MAEHPTSSGSGFAVHGPGLTAYTRTAGHVATELDGFAHTELGAGRGLPAEALSPLAHTSGFTPAFIRFCERAVDTAHALGSALHDVEATVRTARDNYLKTDKAAAEHLSGRSRVIV